MKNKNSKKDKKPKQLTGNVGLYYVSYELAKRGWNVLITTRNARGPDIIAYSQSGKIMHTIQVKALSRRNPTSVGSSSSSQKNFKMSKFVIICNNVYDANPQSFIAKTNQIKINKHGWIEPKDYEKFKDNWKIIGDGLDEF